MRKFILLTAISFLFLSCTDFINGVMRASSSPDEWPSEIELSYRTTNSLMDGLSKKNSKIIKEAFGSALLDDPELDAKIQQIFDSIPGKIVRLSSYPEREHGTGLLHYGKRIYTGTYQLNFYAEQDDGSRQYYDLFYNIRYRDDFYPQMIGIYGLSIIDGNFSACLTDNAYNENKPKYDLPELHRKEKDTGIFINIGNIPFPDGYDEVREIRGELVLYKKTDSPLNYEQILDYIRETSKPSEFAGKFGAPNASSCYADYWEVDKENNGKYLAITKIGSGKDTSYFFSLCDDKEIIQELYSKRDR